MKQVGFFQEGFGTCLAKKTHYLVLLGVLRWQTLYKSWLFACLINKTPMHEILFFSGPAQKVLRYLNILDQLKCTLAKLL